MAGSKIYIRKPLRRFEKAFEEENKVSEEPVMMEETPVVRPDITSPRRNKGVTASLKEHEGRHQGAKVTTSKRKHSESDTTGKNRKHRSK